ncbi:response regulator transcription factor [Anaerosalibacter massiliensis]|uniref:Response regulator transcription factor n=1 Tax=Anaerosalibacter massiliensis TaxID=1347392 RepID=A0A9X2MLG2_9FIRM|nr:response regulator transcription factor [Anaerosalibacter massiliensis]MCR2043371.1 response regulator transcription factor [Anaerosalibacter massiliensis]
MAYKILVVDDEMEIINLLVRYLEKIGYEVISAMNGSQAIKQISKAPDLILLDVNLPDIDGFSICESIRNIVNCPILFLTARIEDEDKIKGFGVGGDDYILKPFSLKELGARVAAHIRRAHRAPVNPSIVYDDGLSIDYGGKKISFRGKDLCFTEYEYKITELLSLHSGQIFDKERIYELIWGYESEGNSKVVVEHIRKIRFKIENVGGKEHIETIWGMGYRWKS